VVQNRDDIDRLAAYFLTLVDGRLTSCRGVEQQHSVSGYNPNKKTVRYQSPQVGGQGPLYNMWKRFQMADHRTQSRPTDDVVGADAKPE
jgi:hypothetical protein